MKMWKYSTASFVFVVALLVIGINLSWSKEEVRKKPFDNYIFIESIPSKAKVYVITKTAWDDDNTNNKKEIFDDKTNYKGDTPLKLKLPPDEYIVYVTYPWKALEKLKLIPRGYSGNVPDFKDYMYDGCTAFRHYYSVINGKDGFELETIYGRLYTIQKKEGLPYVLNPILAANSVRVDQLLSLSPRSGLYEYEFDDNSCKKLLAKYNIDKKDHQNAVKLLHRMGVLPMKEDRLLSLNV